jgi:hypothetical protein
VDPTKTPPMAPPEREGLMHERIPPEAVVTAETFENAGRAARQARWVGRINAFGRGLGVVGIGLSAAAVGYSAGVSIKTGDPKPFVKTVAETAAGFGGAYGGAKLGGLIGASLGGPVGGAIGLIVGGLAGGFATSWPHDPSSTTCGDTNVDTSPFVPSVVLAPRWCESGAA